MKSRKAVKRVQDHDKLIIRLPDGFRTQIAKVAKDTDRTMNAVVVTLIRSGLSQWIAMGGVDSSIYKYDMQAIQALNGVIEKAAEAKSALAARMLLES